MKVTGEINIGNKIIQVDRIGANFSLQAPIGSFLFDNEQTTLEKIGPKPTDWTRSTFKVMMSNHLTWVNTMLDSDVQERADMIDLIMASVKLFKKGEPSSEGNKAVNFLENECTIIGFIPAVTYIMTGEDDRGEGSLEVFWEHPFSTPTLILKHKIYPFLIISNGNLDFDDSRLRKMLKINQIHVEGLGEDDLIEEERQKVMGITG